MDFVEMTILFPIGMVLALTRTQCIAMTPSLRRAFENSVNSIGYLHALQVLRRIRTRKSDTSDTP